MRSKLIPSDTFPADVERAIFGTRIAEFTKEDRLPTQTNFLTHLDRLQRHKFGGEISKCHELLCDMTHPSLGGKVRLIEEDFHRLMFETEGV